ncbi:hypothetical protein, partial [Bradyrhizobium guangdongense]|uniref:hypothetical protein n=1 Tax=Bradyrhizobium guangdongense TaxID=1325090 RepID=UPI00166C0E98
MRIFFVGLIVGFSFPAQAAEGLIKFAPKMFSDGPELIEVSGTLTGAGVAYPNNTQVVTCSKERKECSVVSVEADCQSACKFDPSSASNFDPFVRRVLLVALVSSELA